MARVIAPKFVTINKVCGIVEVFETEPSTHWSTFVLKDPMLVFVDSDLEIEGQKVRWDFSFDTQWVEDMQDEPSEEYVKLGYRSVLDYFKGIKKPYVESGWVKLKKTTPYKCILNKWFVVL